MTGVIEKNTENALAGGLSDVAFRRLDLADTEACGQSIADYKDAYQDAVVYGQFLLYAIPQTSEENFLGV